MRECKYCGVDISHRRSHAVKCEGAFCKAWYQRERRRWVKPKRFCRYCGVDISYRRAGAHKCEKQSCYREYAKEWRAK